MKKYIALSLLLCACALRGVSGVHAKRHRIEQAEKQKAAFLEAQTLAIKLQLQIIDLQKKEESPYQAVLIDWKAKLEDAQKKLDGCEGDISDPLVLQLQSIERSISLIASQMNSK